MKFFGRFDKRAFTFTEVMIAAGLLGGLGLFSLNLNESQTVDQSFSSTALAIETLYQRIYLNMEDPSVCNLTLQGGGGSVANGTAIDEIFDRQGNVFIKKGDKDPRGLVEVESIALANLNKVSGNRAAEVDLEIRFKKLSRVLASSSGERKVTYRIPLQIVLNSSGTGFESCPTPSSDTNQNAVCRDFYGTWDSGTKKCKLPFYGKRCQPYHGVKQGVTYLDIGHDNQLRFYCDVAFKD